MQKKALVVDDSTSMRQMVGLSLKKAGFDVVECCDGQEALNALHKSGQMDVIITDLNMPVMDGITFIREARLLASTKFTPILMLTTESADERKAQAKAAGATGWIVKPFRPDILLSVIQKVVPA
jgi:two-component system chemotaxis response regulator CheY